MSLSAKMCVNALNKCSYVSACMGQVSELMQQPSLPGQTTLHFFHTARVSLSLSFLYHLSGFTKSPFYHTNITYNAHPQSSRNTGASLPGSGVIWSDWTVIGKENKV